MSKTIVELRNTPDDDLIAEHDALAVHTVVGVNYYLDEIRRREAALESWPQEIQELKRTRPKQAEKLQQKLDHLLELMEGGDIRRS